MDVEWHRMANLLQMQAADGLLYTPTSGRPWGKDFGGGAPMFKTELGDHFTGLALLGRMLESAAVYHAMTGDSRWKAMVAKAVRALHRLAIYKRDYALFRKTIYAPGDDSVYHPAESVETPPPNINSSYGWLGQALITVYRMTGDEAALELGYKLAKFYSLGHSGFIGPNDEFRLTHGHMSFEDETGRIHFHTNTQIRMLLLDAGIATGDQEMVELAQRGYAWGRNHRNSNTLMGYFPEFLGVEPGGYGNTTEVCEVADMIYLALRQSTAGIADCWDDVDRWVRNMLTESQLLRTDWVQDYSEKYGVPVEHPYGYECDPAKWVGNWGGWISANDWQGNARSSIPPCCPPNAAMQWYRVWRDMINYDDGRNRLTVHLLLNRASPWADVASHIPYEGLVQATLKQGCEVAIRIPEWTTPAECQCTLNDAVASSHWEGRYVVVRAGAGDTVSLRCPMVEDTRKLTIIDKEYEVVVRGNEIVDIDPPGTRCPIFQRPKYREDKTRWRTIERFVADSVVNQYY